MLNTDFAHWNISFVDTGCNAAIGERLYAVRDYVKNEEVFLANYVDGLSDIDVNSVIKHLQVRGRRALSRSPTQTFIWSK